MLPSENWTLIATFLVCSLYAVFLFGTKWGTRLRVFLTFITVILGDAIIVLFIWLDNPAAGESAAWHMAAGGLPIIVGSVILLLLQIDNIANRAGGGD
jgi:hypothetical protein